MHRCPGNDDLENKKIYEQSLYPEGILKTIKVSEHKNQDRNRRVQRNIPREELVNRINRGRNNLRSNVSNTLPIKIFLLVLVLISFYISLMVAIFG